MAIFANSAWFMVGLLLGFALTVRLLVGHFIKKYYRQRTIRQQDEAVAAAWQALSLLSDEYDRVSHQLRTDRQKLEALGPDLYRGGGSQPYPYTRYGLLHAIDLEQATLKRIETETRELLTDDIVKSTGCDEPCDKHVAG